MNKPSSSRESARVGVSSSVAKTPSNVFARLRRIGAGVAMLTAAACGYNPISRVSTGPADGGGNQDTAADVRPDAPEADGEADAGVDVRPDAGEADAGMDGGADAGSDAGEADAGADAGEDVAVDAGTDVGEDVTEDAGPDGEDVAPDGGSDAGEDAAPDVVVPCVDTDADSVCDDQDLCDLDAADADADGDGCDDLNGDDVCLGDDTNNEDSDGDGMGDGFAIDPVTGEVIKCDPWVLCNPVAEGAPPGTPQELWCDPNSDSDADGVPDMEDCYPLDASRDCGDREEDASIIREWIRQQIEMLERGKGNSVHPESRLA